MGRKSQKGRSLIEPSASASSDAVKEHQAYDLGEKPGGVDWKRKANEVFGPSNTPGNEELLGRVRKSLEREVAKKRNTSRDLAEFLEAFREFVPPVIEYCKFGNAARIPFGDPDPAYFLEGQRHFTALWYVATKVPPQRDWPDSDRTLWMLLHTLKSKVRKLWLAIHRIDPEIKDPLIKLRMEAGFGVEDIEIFETSEPIEPSRALEFVMAFGESLSESFHELREDKPDRATDHPQSDFGQQRPHLNDLAYVVLLALYQLGQPQNRKVVRNKANDLGASLDEFTASKYLSSVLKKNGFAETVTGKNWVITSSGKHFVKSDARWVSYRIDD